MTRISSRSAFTLVELLTVVAIIGILAGLVLGVSGYASKRSDRSRAVAQMEKIRTALEEYRAQNGIYPPSGTTGVLIRTSDAAFSNFVATVSKQAPRLYGEVSDVLTNAVDPWGRAFYYHKLGHYTYALRSDGPDALDTNDNLDTRSGTLK